MKEKTSSLLFRLKTWSSFALFILFIVSECVNFIRQDTNKYHPWEIPGGTQPRLIFGGVDYQCVIKCSVETRPKKACISTLYLKWCLIISELQNAPWPRPANALIGFIKLFRRSFRAQLRLSPSYRPFRCGCWVTRCRSRMTSGRLSIPMSMSALLSRMTTLSALWRSRRLHRISNVSFIMSFC